MGSKYKSSPESAEFKRPPTAHRGFVERSTSGVDPHHSNYVVKVKIDIALLIDVIERDTRSTLKIGVIL